MNFQRSVIIAGLWRPEVARRWNFVRNFAFFDKRPLAVKLSKFCSESFHRLTDRRCCVQISWNLADGKSAKSCVIYWTEKKTNIISHAPQNVATAQIAPKICQGQPQQCAPDFIPIGSHSAELSQNAWTPPKVNPILGGSNTFQPNKDVGLVDSTQRHTRYIRPAYIKHGGRDGKFMTTVYILRMQPRYSDSIAHRACINARQHGHPLSVRGPFRTTSYRAVRYH